MTSGAFDLRQPAEDKKHRFRTVWLLSPTEMSPMAEIWESINKKATVLTGPYQHRR